MFGTAGTVGNGWKGLERVGKSWRGLGRVGKGWEGLERVLTSLFLNYSVRTCIEYFAQNSNHVEKHVDTVGYVRTYVHTSSSTFPTCPCMAKHFQTLRNTFKHVPYVKVCAEKPSHFS